MRGKNGSFTMCAFGPRVIALLHMALPDARTRITKKQSNIVEFNKLTSM